MANILKNKTITTLLSSDVFEILGMSLFNIILLTYAKSYANASLMVSLVSIAAIIPGLFGFAFGRLADATMHKPALLIITKVMQGCMYLILAQIITQHTAIIFGIVLAINLFSDLLANYNSSLIMPIIQTNVSDNLRQQTLGLINSVSQFLQPIGQSIGIAIIGSTHNYALAGYINAIAFFMAALMIILGYRHIQVQPQQQAVLQPLETATAAKSDKLSFKATIAIFQKSSGLKPIPFLSAIIISNAIGASMDALFNLFYLDNPHISSFPFAINILITSIVFIIGSISGGLIPFKLIDHLRYKTIVILSLLFLAFTICCFWFIKNFILIQICLFISIFMMAKANPKLQSEIMKNTDVSVISSVLGTIMSITALAIPIGSIGLVCIYNLISPNATYSISALALLISLSLLIFNHQPQHKSLPE